MSFCGLIERKFYIRYDYPSFFDRSVKKMKSLIIIQDTTLESFNKQTMDYLHAKYHTYPHVFERVPNAEKEIEDLASFESVVDDLLNVSIPVGKLVL